MTSRWAYEALAVEQFKNNRYMREFFSIEQEISNAAYLESFLVPTLESVMDETQQFIVSGREKAQVQLNIEMLDDQLVRLGREVSEGGSGRAIIPYHGVIQ